MLNYAKSQDGTAIAWSKAGSGPPLVRFGHWMSHLHLDRDCPVWAPLIERLEQNFDLIRYDVRGTGLSERGAPLTGLQCFVDDLNAVLSASGIQKTSLYASSQAVPIAVAFAHQFPEKVDKMVLWGGSCDGRKIRKQGDNHLNMDTALSLVRSAWGQNGGVFQEAFNRLFMPDASADQIKSIAQTQRQTADAQTAVDLRQIVDTFNVSDLLEHVTTQTLVVHANQDTIHPFSEGQKLVAGLPNADISMLDSRNHVPLPQDPNWPGMVDAITRFLLATDH
ncbi:MAG: alpha/beta hydrolase [Amylibacter sp.]|nr:alpha/beta hydrolase [Amylibacter sp.]